MRHFRRTLLLVLTMCLFLAACGSTAVTAGTTPTPQPVNLNVFAASSLNTSFNEIKTTYQTTHPGVTLTYNFAGSQTLVQQMTNGANSDIFASADLTNMQKAKDANLVNPSQVFARNKLVVIVPVSNPANITTLKDLAKGGVKIVVGVPAVPIGKYALQVLDNLGKASDYGVSYESSVKGNFVSQEDQVTAVVQKVQLGDADAGIVYQTDVTPSVASKVKVIDIPDAFNVVAQYPIATLKNSAHPTQAQAFVQYLLSPAGQTVLKKYHFITANG